MEISFIKRNKILISLNFFCLIIVFCSFFYLPIFAQNPVKIWDKRFGGSGHDFAEAVCKTIEGDYIIVGSTYSPADGDVSESPKGTFDADMWIVNLDKNGLKKWDKRFGGSGEDIATAIVASSDGGYIIAGKSNSPADGDFTDSPRGEYDFLALKIDEDGNKVWDKRFGGSSHDFVNTIINTPDGGYVLVGNSLSPSDGDKTEGSRGDFDFWIVKIDSNGDKKWDKRYGGDSIDVANAIVNASNGDFIIVGSSSSQGNGDKTEELWGNYNYSDIWVVKVDSNGNKIWDKRFGGSKEDVANAIISTPEGEYIIAGSSDSPNNGDKTETSRGFLDFWVLKIDNNGNKIWDKRFGGSIHDVGKAIQATPDNGFVIVGDSYSTSDGDKTENSKTQVGVNGQDYWTVKIDANGNKVWDKSFGGNTYDQAHGIISSSENEFLIVGNSDSPLSGDLTESSKGHYDYWIVKFGFTTSLEDSELLPDFNVLLFPNPSRDLVNISWNTTSEKPTQLNLFDLYGRIVWSQKINGLNGVELSLANFPSGLYTLEAVINDKRQMAKVVKE